MARSPLPRPLFRTLARHWRPLALALAAITIALAASVAGAAPPSAKLLAAQAAARQAGVPETQLPRFTRDDIAAVKGAMLPWQRKVDWPVFDAIGRLQDAGVLAPAARAQAVQYATKTMPIDAQARLEVEFKATDASAINDAFIRRLGGETIARAQSAGYVTAWIPADQIEAIASRPDVKFVRHVDPTYADIGARLTEGDAVHRAALARSTFGINGAGVTVGAISDGVSNIASAQGTSDLPAVNVLNAGSGDEGTAMLEIIADLAPGAALAFSGGGSGTAGMVNAINGLAGVAGMDVITDDLAQPQEPLFEDGPIAQAKINAVNAGIFYTCSAGNRANQHYQGNLNAGAPGSPHDFGGGDQTLGITLAANNDLYLQWAEPFGSAGTDLDLYVIDGVGNVIAASNAVQDGDDNPSETLSFSATAGTAAQIVVVYYSGPGSNVFFDLRSFTIGFNEHVVAAGSVNGASRQPQVYAAAACNQTTPGTVASYSSRGPALRFFPSQVTRNKPDGTATDGVTVTGAGCFACGASCPPVPASGCQFFGTSAATPHVAGLAALLLQALPGTTPAAVANAFNVSAVDIDSPGYDFNSGNGRLDIFAALCSFDVTGPTITSCPVDITVECESSGGTPASSAALNGFFSAFAASDICTPTPVLSNDAPAFFLTGTTTKVTFTAKDQNNNASTCSAYVTVEDTTPPVLTCPDSIVVECTQSGGTPASDPAIVAFLAGFSATDICDASLTLSNDAPLFFNHGLTTVTFKAVDDATNTSTCERTVRVVDTTPPTIVVTLDHDVLWPPNHKLVDIGATVEVHDICDPNPTFVLTSITSNEPDDGTGDGDTVNDIQGTGFGTSDVDFQLRSERKGNGTGRKYTVIYTASDADGNTASDTACVRVPHDQSGHALAAYGFKLTGGLDAGSDHFAIVVPTVAGTSTSGPALEQDPEGTIDDVQLGTQAPRINENFDAADLDPAHAYVGNLHGVITPLGRVLVDVTGDGRKDAVLWYDLAPALKLVAESAADDGALGLHYQDAGATRDLLISDLTTLGTPLDLPPSAMLAGGETGGESDPGNRKVGNTVQTVLPSIAPPSLTELVAVRPTPTFGDAAIDFALARSGPVSLVVFDLRGATVRTLVSRALPAGRHSVTWDGRDNQGRTLARGVYMVRLSADGRWSARKAILMH